jgi:hypothetical protein
LTAVEEASFGLRRLASDVGNVPPAIENMNISLSEAATMLPSLTMDAYEFAHAMKAIPAAISNEAVSGLVEKVTTIGSSLKSAFMDLPNVILSAITGGGSVGGAIGGSIFSKLFGAESGLVKSLTGSLTGMFGKTIGSALGSVIPGVGTLLGSQLGEWMMKGLSKIGGFFKDLFGGISQAEKEGREEAAAFRRELEGMLTDAQRLEAGNEAWKRSVIAVRDAYIANGRTGQEALAIMDRLWRAEKEGGDAVRDVIAQINEVIGQGLTPALREATMTGVAGMGAIADSMERLSNTPVVIPIRFDVESFDWPEMGSSPSGSGVGGFRPPTQADMDKWLRENPGDEHRFAQAWSNITDEAANAQGIFSYASGTGGRYINFGTGSPAILHGRERVMTEAEGQAEASAWAAMSDRLASIERLLREQPRSIGMALQTALLYGGAR